MKTEHGDPCRGAARGGAVIFSPDAHRRVPELAFLVAPVLFFGVLTLGGCALCRDMDDTGLAYCPTRISPGLILNTSASPGIDPQLFAYRSLWPATEGDADLGATTFYRVLWYDRQTLFPHRADYSYRLFQSSRVGIQVR